MLGAVLERTAQLVRELLVFLGRLAALYGAREGVGNYPAGFALDEQRRGGADDLKVLAVDVEQVRGRVDGPQVSVYVEGVQARGPGKPLRGDGLEDVAPDDVLLELGDVRLVALAANVGLGLLAEDYGGCLLYTSPSPRALVPSRMPSSA